MLDRHKRLYLDCTDGTCMLFKLPVASVCKHDKAGTKMNRKTIRSPRTIVYKLAKV